MFYAILLRKIMPFIRFNTRHIKDVEGKKIAQDARTKRSALVSRLIIDFLKQHADYLIEEISMPIITWARRHAAFRHDGA